MVRGQKGEVQISQVVIDGASPGFSADQGSSRFFKGIQVAFLPGILVLPDHNRFLILP